MVNLSSKFYYVKYKETQTSFTKHLLNTCQKNLNPLEYRGPKLALKMSVVPVLALYGVPMHILTMFCRVLEQMKHKFEIVIKNDVLLTSMLDTFQSPWRAQNFQSPQHSCGEFPFFCARRYHHH